MTSNISVRSFAFFHTDFQPTPETDLALGRGWTEWSDVAKAKPLYVGHLQRRLPRDLGFYDLRVAAAREEQANTARQYGIDGFIYNHYWFNGRRIYDTPRANIDFALCWINGDFCTPEGEVIIAQTYNDDDDRVHFRDVVQQMTDPRYIRIDNLPLFVVDDASVLPNSARTAEIWREEARIAGIGEIFLACRGAQVAPGFDACIEGAMDVQGPAPVHYETLATYNYLDAASAMLAAPATQNRRFSCVTPNFDSTPATGMNGTVLLESQPDIYKGWVASVIQRDAEQSNDVILFVDSWNHWTHGTQLEPCSVWGTQYLEAHQAGVNQAVSTTSPSNPVTQVVPTAATPTSTVISNEAHPRVGLTVAMVANGDAGAIMRTLQSALDTCTDVGRLEFVVVDNGSQDDTEAMLHELRNEVFSIRNDTPQSPSQAWDQARQVANGEFIVFVSNDIVMQPKWLEGALLTLATDPTTVAISPRISIGNQLLISQPLTMTSGVCMVARTAIMGTELPQEARVVDYSVVMQAMANELFAS